MTEVATRSIVVEPFDDLEQQHEAARLGMWIFLATEVLFFGGLFLSYTVYRSLYPETFAAASRHTKVILGGTNTAILLLSSTLMALAVRVAQLGRRRLVGWLLIATATLGVVFLALKGLEYRKDFVEHLVPGTGFQWREGNPSVAELFFWLYFAMTGLHAIHVLIGISLLTTFAFLAWNRRFDHGRHMPVEIVGLYWHFVDIVWVFLFPLLYLAGHWTNCIVLLVLLALTWTLGYVNFGIFNLCIALGIAFAKAILIVLFFMHIKGSSRLLHLAAVIGLLWLFLMLLLTLGDYCTRG
jgi:cytochrome c oxidase subunit 3